MEPTAAARAGCACGVEGRIVADDGSEQPWDGKAVGELEVRGPWVTAGYYNSDDPEVDEKFHDGWLRTGDVGSIDELGYIRLSDRAKDVIKSGWRVDLLGRPGERPDGARRRRRGGGDRHPRREVGGAAARLGRRARGRHADPRRAREFLSKDFAKWQLPDSWAFIDEVPRTSVGKFDKKVIRKWYAEDEIEVEKAE